CNYGSQTAMNDDCAGLCSGVSFTCPSSGKFNVMTGSYNSSQPSSLTIHAHNAIFPFYDWVSGTSLAPCAETITGSARSCGYQSFGYGTCYPGNLITVSGGWSASDTGYVLRACAGSVPCVNGSLEELAETHGEAGSI